MENNKDKKMKNKKIKIIFIVLTLIIVVTLVFLKIRFGNKVVGDMKNIPFNGNYKNIAILDEEIYILNGNNIKSYDKEGKDKISSTIPINDAKIIGESNKLFVYDNKNMYILDSEAKILKKLEIPFEIEYVNLKKEIIYIVGEDNYECYDFEGELITKGEIEDAISTISVSSEKTNLVVTSLSSTEDNFKSNIYLKDIEENKEIKQTFLDEVIMHSEFVDDERYLTVSNKQIIVFENFQIINKIMIDDFKDISISDSNIFVLKGDILNVYDFDLKIETSVELESDFKNIYAEGNKAALIGGNNYGYYKHKGDKISELYSVEDIQGYIINNNGLYLLHTDTVTKAKLSVGGNNEEN
ncbi:DUF5711 family protein [Miniphocaeibacter massiliensis]|uniref:DUF5711 family protein n=1 Tax=Miniphocaeibacter massiliensis TaxID=2041841 RepID=UPI000C1BA062|nr:DUF5711 family protein [Miniphocaeibacter massiliensis]